MTWLDRQSFLGAKSDARLDAATVGLVGLGGGNSHVAQQLVHVGIGGFVLLDDDIITLTNLNRLVGGTLDDVKAERPKVEIAARVIRAVNPNARIVLRQAKWQEAGELLRGCDIIVGGLDHIGSKDELEAFCRRFMIPYIDMGMDVTLLHESGESLVSGQVILSTPGEPCLRCLQLVTDERLKAEAQRYGAAGSRPQVVWPNGALASTAVGLVVQLITPWMHDPPRSAYFAYDANLGTITPSDRLARRLGRPCPHYPAKTVGDPMFDVRRYLERIERLPPSEAAAQPRPQPVASRWSIRAVAAWLRKMAWF
jgi:molybdopterin/thiamine biosynthesis adenylyltransferase